TYTREFDRHMSAESARLSERTQPLPTIATLLFEGFLARHQLSILDVAQAANIRLLIIWRVARDLPVSAQQARQVYSGLRHLAGVPYRGRIRLQTSESEGESRRLAPVDAGKVRWR
ncbi:MAG: hypothetical protein ACRDHW_21365, partial [Ktedonobacteraceae bacterium]